MKWTGWALAPLVLALAPSCVEAKARPARPTLFSTLATFKKAAPKPNFRHDFEGLLGTADYPVGGGDGSPGRAMFSDKGLDFRTFSIHGGGGNIGGDGTGEVNYLRDGEFKPLSLNGDANVVSGAAYVEILAQGATAFGFDFGVTKDYEGDFKLRFEFTFKDGTKLKTDRIGHPGQSYFIGVAGKPLARVAITNITPMPPDSVSERPLPMVLIDNVITTIDRT